MSLIQTLKHEFIWLTQQYPMANFEIEPLKIYPNDAFLKNNPTKSVDGFIYDFLSTGKVKFGICMTVDTKQAKAENACHVLYHEYGHLLDMYDYYTENGTVALLRLLEKHDEHVQQLLCREDDGDYRDLPLEQKAEEFAQMIERKRVSVFK